LKALIPLAGRAILIAVSLLEHAVTHMSDSKSKYSPEGQDKQSDAELLIQTPVEHEGSQPIYYMRVGILTLRIENYLNKMLKLNHNTLQLDRLYKYEHV
jgi:hypothetical protein